MEYRRLWLTAVRKFAHTIQRRDIHVNANVAY